MNLDPDLDLDVVPDLVPEAAAWPLLQQALRAGASGDADEAMRLLKAAALERPGSDLPHFMLGAELAQAGRVDEAEAAYARAVLLSPTRWMARFQLGLLQFTAGRTALALLSWQPLLSIDQADPLYHFAQAFLAWAQGLAPEAAGWFDSGIRAHPANAALNADMQLARRRLLAECASDGFVQGVPDAADSPDVGNHVLLSNYRR